MESIIIFIIFVVISSLFNKDKKGQRQRPARRNPSPVENREVQQQKRPTQQKTTRTTSGGFGDLIKDLKADFDDVFKEGQQQAKGRTGTYRQRLEPAKETPEMQQYSYEYQEQYLEYVKEDLEEKPQAKKETQKEKQKEKQSSMKGTVYKGEIGRKSNRGRISFDRESVTRAIIMNEVLGKPKSMKR